VAKRYNCCRNAFIVGALVRILDCSLREASCLSSLLCLQFIIRGASSSSQWCIQELLSSLPSLPSFLSPFPSPVSLSVSPTSVQLPPSGSQPLHPLNPARRLGGVVSTPSRSGRSPAAKRILVHSDVKMKHFGSVNFLYFLTDINVFQDFKFSVTTAASPPLFRLSETIYVPAPSSWSSCRPSASKTSCICRRCISSSTCPASEVGVTTCWQLDLHVLTDKQTG